MKYFSTGYQQVLDFLVLYFYVNNILTSVILSLRASAAVSECLSTNKKIHVFLFHVTAYKLSNALSLKHASSLPFLIRGSILQ
jgi:hypothetical protein